MKSLRLFFALAFLAVAVPFTLTQQGCTQAPSARVVQVQTLLVVGQTAKAGMDASTTLLKQGAITVPQWQNIANFYDLKFQPAYNMAVQIAKSDLSSIASPDLAALGAQLASLVGALTAPSPSVLPSTSIPVSK